MGAEGLPRALALAAALACAATGAGALAIDEERALVAAGGLLPPLPAHEPHRAILPVEAGGVEALRFDGNSTWGESAGPVTLAPREGIVVSALVALASPPIEAASVLDVAAAPGASALRLAVGPWLRPEFVVGDLRAAGADPLPLGRFVRLEGVVDARGARLYVDGALVARSAGAPPERVEGVAAVGRTRFSGARDIHPHGVWNGLLGELAVGAGSRPSGAPTPAEAPDLAPPQAWLSDRLRPRIHPMPPIGWTNEPHALARREGMWILHHQANPNGAFWDHMVWGELASRDLVSWEDRGPSLIPSTGFDRRGVWVGNWIPDVDPPSVLYTGVNGERSGLGIARLAEDGRLVQDGPPVASDTPPGYQDMRDPFVLRDGAGWLALVGAGALDREEALVLAFRSDDAREWRFVGEFDVGSASTPGEYWELPVLRPLGDRHLLMGTPVIRDAEARSLYWIGTFDGDRFVPDLDAPRDASLFGAMLAPTLAEDEDGRTVAIGILPDGGQRPEAERAAAGWVHALSLPFEVAPADDERGALAWRLAREVRGAFGRTVARRADVDLGSETVRVDPGPGPVLVEAVVAAPAGSEVVLGLAASADGSEVTRLRLRPAEGRAGLDRSDSSSAPFAARDLRWGGFPPAETVAIEVVVDGAALTGSIGARAFGALVYPESADATGVVVAADGPARLVSFTARRLD